MEPLCLHVEPPTWIPAEPWKSWNPKVAASRGGLGHSQQSQEGWPQFADEEETEALGGEMA